MSWQKIGLVCVNHINKQLLFQLSFWFMLKYMTQVQEFNHQSRLLAKMPEWATASTPDSGPVAQAEWCHLRETGRWRGVGQKVLIWPKPLCRDQRRGTASARQLLSPANVCAVCQSTGQPGPSSQILGLSGIQLCGLCWGQWFVGLPGMQHPLKDVVKGFSRCSIDPTQASQDSCWGACPAGRFTDKTVTHSTLPLLSFFPLSVVMASG